MAVSFRRIKWNIGTHIPTHISADTHTNRAMNTVNIHTTTAIRPVRPIAIRDTRHAAAHMNTHTSMNVMNTTIAMKKRRVADAVVAIRTAQAPTWCCALF